MASPWGTWQEWATGTVTFLTGLAAIWTTLRAVRRRDRAQDARLDRTGADREEHDYENALAQCWDFARKRERWYSEDRRSLLTQLATKDELVEQMRREIHAARNSWSEEQLRRVRLEETVRWLTAELEEYRARHPRSGEEREDQGGRAGPAEGEGTTDLPSDHHPNHPRPDSSPPASGGGG